MFGTSAMYHRPSWGPKARQVMRRLDHAAIFLLIAGTNTPLALLALDSTQAGGCLAGWHAAAGQGLGGQQCRVRTRSCLPAFFVTLPTGRPATPVAPTVPTRHRSSHPARLPRSPLGCWRWCGAARWQASHSASSSRMRPRRWRPRCMWRWGGRCCPLRGSTTTPWRGWMWASSWRGASSTAWG